MPDQDDLTGDDRLVADTAKDGPDSADAALPLPAQDPAFVPPSTVDADGDPA